MNPAAVARVFAVLFAVLFAACTTGPSPEIPRDVACHEQADAWCERAGFAAAPGCTVWYVHECEPAGPDGTLDASAQDACLDAIATNPVPTVEPGVCVETWNHAPA